MARNHYRVRSLVPGPNTSTYLAFPNPKMVCHNARPRLNTDSLLRTWASMEFTVLVTSDNPPVITDWWYDTFVTMTVAWTSTTGTLMPSVNDSSDFTLGTQQLVPTMTPSDKSDSYVVRWTSPEQVDIKSMRSGRNTYLGPAVNMGVQVYDPNSALNGNIDEFSVSVNYMGWLHTLWASDAPV